VQGIDLADRGFALRKRRRAAATAQLEEPDAANTPLATRRSYQHFARGVVVRTIG